MRMRSTALAAAVLVSAVVAAPALAAAPQSAIDRAAANARANAAVTKVGTGQQLVVRDAIVDPNGTTHVRFDRTYNGLRVIGGDLVVHSAASGAFLGASLTLTAPPAVPTVAKVPQANALKIANGRLVGVASGRASAELVVYAGEGTAALAWDTVQASRQFDRTPSELHVVVDATTGAILDQWDAIQTASGQGYFSGTVTLDVAQSGSSYLLKDPTRGNQFTCDGGNTTAGCSTPVTDADGVFGDGTLANRQTVAVDAQYGTAMTWDYYKTAHNRNGIANNGVGAYNRVHYDVAYNNAFWSDSCFCMTYGDGDGVTFNPFDSLDVAGHEMSHGVTSRTANLRYSGESGGLNESTSDIFGTMVEYYANNPNDPPDYYIGEELYRSGTSALRAMFKPSLDGRSRDCWSRSVATLDVHYSSGIGNHFYYLLAEGSAPVGMPASPTCNGKAVVGIGRDKAGKIWYRALTTYMTSSTKYAGARTATLSAAADLYGSASTEYKTVAAAWSAVSVN